MADSNYIAIHTKTVLKAMKDCFLFLKSSNQKKFYSGRFGQLTLTNTSLDHPDNQILLRHYEHSRVLKNSKKISEDSMNKKNNN